MISVGRLSILALGVVVSIGIAFLLWTLYHLCCEARPQITVHRSHLSHPRAGRRVA